MNTWTRKNGSTIELKDCENLNGFAVSQGWVNNSEPEPEPEPEPLKPKSKKDK